MINGSQLFQTYIWYNVSYFHHEYFLLIISYKSTKEGLIILDIILLVIRMIMYIVFLMYNLSLSCKLKVVAHNNTHFKHLSLLPLPLVILLVVSFVIVLTWRHEQNTKWRKWKFSAFEFQTTFLEIAHAIYRSMFAYYLVFHKSDIYTGKNARNMIPYFLL